MRCEAIQGIRPRRRAPTSSIDTPARAAVVATVPIEDAISGKVITPCATVVKNTSEMRVASAVSSWYGGQALLRGTTRSVDDVVQELEAVREEDIVRVAEQLITDDSLRLAVVGPFDDADRFEQTLHL